MNTKLNSSTLMVVLAFAILYIVWGSTFFFIKLALVSFPPFILGFLRFMIAGIIMLSWSIYKREKIWDLKVILQSALIGVLLLFIGNGAVIFAEKSLPSSLTAIIASSSPIWFVILDKKMWVTNFKSASTITGLLIGFMGVVLLFSDQLFSIGTLANNSGLLIAMSVLIFGSLSWTIGSLYSKYHGSGSALANTTWQMICASLAFLIAAISTGETEYFKLSEVRAEAWNALIYLILMGSIAGYSAYIWLLSTRPVTQVSTYAYVNPVVAVLLGYFLGKEYINSFQILGLGVILLSILMINLNKYRKAKKHSFSF